MVCKDTLRIKHLPKELSDAQKEDFVRHFGAIKVKVITSRAKEQSVVYAKFESPEVAKAVITRLHQITVLNSILSVDYAQHDTLQGKPLLKKIEETDLNKTKFFRTFLNKVNGFNDSLGFHQPPPSHLKYNYPKANRATINNIAHALATIPRFYTQVLHLMNKMNLPPPFAVVEPPVRTITPSQHPVIQKVLDKPATEDSESELESDNEDKVKEIIPQKRSLPQKKIVKRPKLVNKNNIPQSISATRKIDKPEDVFEKVETVPTSKKIELKVDNTVNTNVTPQEVTGTIGLQTKDGQEQPAGVKTDDTSTSVISLEQLLANQIPAKDLNVLPVFKNYHPGPPTNRLYIKNCAKTVALEDLEFIYKRYIQETQTEDEQNTNSQFDIRLMQEGRMKGQAFVTLESVELAQKALKETNGYMLKEKPLVVVFAKSAAQKNK